MIYYVIIALAITESLNKLFLYNISSIFLFAAFLFTICRFAHGASIHLIVYTRKRYKPIFDFIEFFFQAGFFYLMATALINPRMFTFLFILMLTSDAIWILLLWLINYIKLDRTHKQWFNSNLLMIILLVLFSFLSIDHSLYSFLVMILSITATVFDYTYNNNFYFPPIKRNSTNGLKQTL